MFDKVTAETRRVQGSTQGNAEVIRGLKTIENKNEFFANLARMNKQMNKNKLRVSLAPDGKPLINNQFKVSVSQLKSLGNEGRNQLFASYGPANVTTRNVPTRIYPSNTSAGTSSSTERRDISCYIRPEEIIKITTFLIRLSSADKDFIDRLLSQMSQDLHDAFLLLCSEVFVSLLPSELKALQGLGSNYAQRVVLFLFNFIKSRIRQADYENDNAFEVVLREFVCNGQISPNTIGQVKTRLMNWFAERIRGNAENFDPKIYDEMHQFRIHTDSQSYMNLQAGETINIGNHTVFIKGSTIDNLEKWLVGYSQEYCDIFINFCLEIISILRKKEVKMLNLVNPDEDLIQRIADFFVSWHDIGLVLIRFEEEGISSNFVVEVKNDLVNYWNKQTLRRHGVCKLCKGINYMV